jgi:hypothetical protein
VFPGGSTYSMRVNRPEAEIVLKALNFWVCKSKMTRSSGILISAWSFRSVHRNCRSSDPRKCGMVVAAGNVFSVTAGQPKRSRDHGATHPPCARSPPRCLHRTKIPPTARESNPTLLSPRSRSPNETSQRFQRAGLGASRLKTRSEVGQKETS